MCEITRINFEEKYPQIIDDLHSALFITLDCEFTGLFNDDYRCSLFDSPKIRFKKLQSCLEKYLIIQFGLSTFKYERQDNSFTVSTYTFYLTPTPLAENQNFKFHIGSLEFLCQHNFDFNKSFYDGIYFLNKLDEAKALQVIEDGSLARNYDEEIKKHCSVVNEWSINVPVGSEMFLELGNERRTFVCLLHQEIRKQSPQTWTYFEKNGVKIKKVTDTQRRELNKEDILLKKNLLDSLLGFSRIMKEIQSLKKPIVGHNFLIDLIKIYQQFYNPVPVSYTEFKRAVNDLFPNIYDTKHMSFKLRDILKKKEIWNSNCLSDLYQYFKIGKGSSLVIYTPTINHKRKNYETGANFHEAGFDSYVTGFCFLKMAHAFSLWSEEKQSFHLTSMPTSASWLLGAIATMKNRVNVSRGQVNYIAIDGPDPKNIRPGLIYIQSRKNKPVDVEEISELIAKFGSVDIQPLSKFTALMAVSNQRQLDEILQSLQNADEFIVQKYNFLKHSSLGRVILSGAIIASSVLATIITLKGWKKG